MADTPWYKEWFNSPFYHKLYFERDDQEAEKFIDQLVQYLNPGPQSVMLDLGCGRGRHSRKLASLGFTVTGVDLAPASIAYARQFETEKLSFFEHDMRLPFWGNFYDFIFNFFTSFGYFRTRREHDSAIRTVSAALKPGGVFVIDYLNVHYTEDHLVTNETKKIGDTSYEIQRWHDDMHFFKKIYITDPSLVTPLSFTEKVTKFSLGDFTDMLSFQGLQVKDVFGSYDLGPYDTRKTPRMIIVASKKDNVPADKQKRLYSDGRKTDALT